MHSSEKKRLSVEQALIKMRQYCAYSERCHSDVVGKLYDLGVYRKDHDTVLATLIEENFLNEERYAKAFAGGHFRQKQWGRNKIKQSLKLKQISDYCIKKGMLEIEEEAYTRMAAQLFQQKWESMKHEKNRFIKMRKTFDYMIRKGFETDLINNCYKQFVS